MSEIAARSPLIKGVVGWVDFTAPDAANRVRVLSRNTKLKGLRPMLQGLSDDWILNPAFDPVLTAMIDTGLTFDALVFTRHLKAIETLAKRYPDLPIVIDHGAKPPLAAADPQVMLDWRDALSRVAETTNVWCKLSGLPAEMSPTQSPDALKPCADHMLSVFGPYRLIWGSDWPVCLLRMSYAEWLDWVRDGLSPLSPSDQARILGGNATDFYTLA